MGGRHPHVPRPELTISNPWKSGRMAAVGLASLSLSKAGTLTTKTAPAVGTASVTIATSASRKANASVWDSQPNEDFRSSVCFSLVPDPSSGTVQSRARSGWMTTEPSRPTAAGFCPRRGCTPRPQTLRQVSPQRCPLSFHSNRIFVGPRNPRGDGDAGRVVFHSCYGSS